MSETGSEVRMLLSCWDGGRAHLNRTLSVASEAMSRDITCGFIVSDKYAEDAQMVVGRENTFVIPTRPESTAPPPYPFPLYSHAYGHGQRLMGLGFNNIDWLAKTTRQEINAIRTFKPSVIVNDYRDTIRTSAEACEVPVVGITHTTGNVDGYTFGWWIAPPPGTKIPTCVDSFNEIRSYYDLPPFDDERYMFSGDTSILPSSPSIDPLIKNTHPSYYVGKLARSDMTGGNWKPMPSSAAKHRFFSYVGEASRPDYGYPALMSGAMESMPNAGFYIDGNVYDYNLASIGGRIADGSIIISKTLPGPQVIPDCTAVICHGGNGTVMQALTHGKPIICVGPYQTDCSSIMRRVVEAGGGIMINHSKKPLDKISAPDLGEGVDIYGYWSSEITSDDIKGALVEVAENRTYTERALSLGQEIASLGGVERAVDICCEVARQN